MEVGTEEKNGSQNNKSNGHYRDYKTLTGDELSLMFAAATSWLAKTASDIDALNVFPVPDGDTGTNMLLTMRASIEEVSKNPSNNASTVAHAIAKGALMGARGNSGVILSQIWRGLARSLNSKDTVSGAEFAAALHEACETAYKGLSNPVEGTMLTVIKDASTAALSKISVKNGDITSVLEASVRAARESVANTPNLLPVLKEAGVVDAGGQGLYILLEGALLYLRGELDLMQSGKSKVITGNIPESPKVPAKDQEEVPFGFCTEFLIEGENLDVDQIRRNLEGRGQSLIVVGDKSVVRVHIHTLEPDSVLRYADSLGSIHDAAIRNMDEQHKYFLAVQKGKAPPSDISIVAVVTGDGLIRVFKDLGVSALIPAGQTMNPSTTDILHSVEAAQTDKVIILPNNKNIILTAQQVQALTNKSIKVVPSENMPQGVAALVAFSPEEGLDTNAEYMTKVKSQVRTLEITRATRSAGFNGIEVKEGQAIGLLDGELRSAHNETIDVVLDLLAKVNMAKVGIITVYYGEGVDEAQANLVSSRIQEHYPAPEIETVYGGQRYYQFIISAE